MYRTHCLMVINSSVKYGMSMSEDKKAVVRTQNHVKNYKFDLGVKGQQCFQIMNVCDTLSHGDRLMCQIW